MKLTKYQITPWTSSLNVDIDSQQKVQSTSKLLQVHLKSNKQIKLSRLSTQRHLNLHRDPRINLKTRNISQISQKIIYPNPASLQQNSLKRLNLNMITKYSIDNQPYQINFTSTFKTSKTIQNISSPNKVTKSQSYRNNMTINHSIDQDQKNKLFQSVVYEKPKIKLQKSQILLSNPQEKQIFKKLDQISKKRKKQIKLPKIAVLYASKRM